MSFTENQFYKIKIDEDIEQIEQKINEDTYKEDINQKICVWHLQEKL